MDIAKYYASLGIRIERKEIAKVDSTLKLLERKLKTFGKKMDKHLRIKLKISTFGVDQKKLDRALGNALDLASTKTRFEISRFIVNDRALMAAILRAMRRLPPLPPGGGPGPGPRPPPGGGPGPDRGLVRAGMAGGVASRLYGPAIGLAMGGYGLAQLNRLNQETISAQLTTQAVTEAAGLQGQGPQAFEWLRGQGHRIGFDYLAQAQDYNNFLSNSLGAGQTLDQSQEVYLGFSEYQRAMGITAPRQKLVLGALSQMQGKGVVSMEELRRQMAESLPGTMSIFAQAFQEMSGGDKTGQEAIAALLKAVPTGTVQSSEILPIVARIMRERAAPKLDVAMKTSQAEQGRLKSTVTDMAVIAGKSGVETGFARLFKAMTVSLEESAPLVESMARGFDRASKSFSEILLNVQSFKRFFEGRDSYIGDKLFPDEDSRQKAFLWMSSVRDLFVELQELGSNIGEGWNQIFEKMFSSSMLERFREVINNLTNLVGAINDAAAGNWASAGEKLKSVGWTMLDTATKPAEGVLNAISDDLGTNYKSLLMPDKPFNPAEFESDKRAQQKMAIAQQRASDYANPVYPVPNMAYGSAIPGVTPMEISVDVKAEITAQNAQDFAEQLNDKLVTAIMQFSNKEAH
jgi:tape measure domain-containing protein